MYDLINNKEVRESEVARLAEQVDKRFPMALNFGLSLYANQGIHDHNADDIKTLMAYHILFNHKAVIDEDIIEMC